MEDEAGLARWLKRHGAALFESELGGWYTDPALWPKDRSLKQFKAWCDFELHSLVIDLGQDELVDDDDEFDDDGEDTFRP